MATLLDGGKVRHKFPLFLPVEQPAGVATVTRRLPEGDCLVSLTPQYEGLDTVLLLRSLGQVWPSPEESTAIPHFEPESAIFSFEPGATVEDIVRGMGYQLVDRRQTS